MYGLNDGEQHNLNRIEYIAKKHRENFIAVDNSKF